MRLRALGQWVQMKLHQEILADALQEAHDSGEPPRNIDPETPTVEWCMRLALKHGKAARAKVGKMKGLREDILDRVKRDPDKAGKLKP